MAPPTARAEDVITLHRLSAALASEAVTEAVASCAKQGYKITATVVDSDGVTQAMLRGNGASMTTIGAAHDKAYTVFMLGAPRNEDTSGAIAQRESVEGYFVRAKTYEAQNNSTKAAQDYRRNWNCSLERRRLVLRPSRQFLAIVPR